MAITLRNSKGSALTHGELDANFTTLETDINTVSGQVLDSADVTAIAQGLDALLPILDSADVTAIAQGLDNAQAILDSADVVAIRDAGGYITLSTLQTIVDSSLDFADFKTRIAAL